MLYIGYTITAYFIKMIHFIGPVYFRDVQFPNKLH